MDIQAVTLKLPSITEAKLARKMLRRDVPMPRVIAYLGGCFDETQITAGIERMRVHCRQRNARDTDKGWRGIAPFEPVKNIPPEVTADRDHRASLVPRDTTALRMGDPLPGYFAGDKAPSIAVGWQHDPLDDLMFGRRKIGVMAG